MYYISLVVTATGLLFYNYQSESQAPSVEEFLKEEIPTPPTSSRVGTRLEDEEEAVAAVRREEEQASAQHSNNGNNNRSDEDDENTPVFAK